VRDAEVVMIATRDDGSLTSDREISIVISVPSDDDDGLHLDHIWRGSLLAAIGWAPSAINDPVNLQLLCPLHHADKTGHESQLIAVDSAMSSTEQ